jgi:glycerol-3-phosphate acyltransferase PlsY
MNPAIANYAFLALLFGYFLGSIPFGLILTRMAGLGDVRNIGSGNIGATNVLRTGHKGLAALTLVLDALKGTAAVLVAHKLGGTYGGVAILAGLVAGLGAFLGHIFPVWLGFKGGKGVATYIGVALGVFWPAALIFCGLWLAVAFTTRYSSLSALVSSTLTPLALWMMNAPAAAILLSMLSILLIWKHRANIDRLMKGEEPKIGAKA